MVFRCSHPKCTVTYSPSHPSAVKFARDAGVYHYCLYARRELRLLLLEDAA